MIEGPLSPGQHRLRTVIAEFEGEYRALQAQHVPFTSNLTNAWSATSLLVRVRDRLALEAVIVADKITGRPINEGPPQTYIQARKLTASAQHGRLEHLREPVRFERFVYLNPPDAAPAYTGGVNWPTTFRALLTLAFEPPTFRFELDSEVRYYERSGILEPISGSTHRLLACVLWGKLAVRDEHLRVVFDRAPDDPELLRACEIARRLEFAKPGLPPFTDELDAITRHRTFLLSLSAAEIARVGAHWHGRVLDKLEFIAPTLTTARAIEGLRPPWWRWWRTQTVPPAVRDYLKTGNSESVLDRDG